ncbi:hypothetical protein NQZ68_038895 [Dissostichus eleginoides]|nr:hypothetical protein NQZ68_038895 [Dissostichus eleginoides]
MQTRLRGFRCSGERTDHQTAVLQSCFSAPIHVPVTLIPVVHSSSKERGRGGKGKKGRCREEGQAEREKGEEGGDK